MFMVAITHSICRHSCNLTYFYLFQQLEEDTEGERIVSLTQQQKLFVIGEQIFDIVFPAYPPGLPLQNISSSYRWCYGYVLKSQTYGYESLDELIAAVDTVMVTHFEAFEDISYIQVTTSLLEFYFSNSI